MRGATGARRGRSWATAFARPSGALALLALTLPGGVASAQDEVTPPVVHANVRALQAELELLRVHLDRPRELRPELRVRGAAPREVYYQARSLAERSSRLAFEHLRRRQDLPEPVAPDDVQPRHVLEMVSAARSHTRALLDAFGVEARPPTPAVDPRREPTDVYVAIVQANRQLHLLTNAPFTPSDVWMQVTLAVSYAARLLGAHRVRGRVPAPPPRDPTAEPRDVYRRLLACFARVRDIASSREVRVLTLEVGDEELARIVPSDVYDLASLLVAELAHLHSLRDLPPPVEPYRPGPLEPADVLQRAGILLAQLERLAEQGR